MSLIVKVGSTTITQRRKVSWSDPRRGAGTARFDLLTDDSQNSLLAVGTEVKYYLGATLFLVWNVTKIEKVSIDSDEEAGQFLRYSGATTIAQLDRSAIYPATGVRDVSTPIFVGKLGTKPYDRVRRMGATDPSYDRSGWDDAVEVLPAQGAFMPEGMRDGGGAAWVWSEAMTADAHPIGVCFVELPFTTSGTFSVDIDFAALDGCRLYVDGAFVGQIDSITDADGGQKMRQVTVETTDGSHTLVAYVEHIDASRPGGFLASVFNHGTSTVIARTTDACKVLGYPTTLPGLTSGAITNAFVAESVARDELDGWTTDFTDTADTASTTFPTIPGDVPIQVGDSVLAMVDQLGEGWCETAALAQNGGYVLSQWVIEGTDLPGGGTAPARGDDTAVEIEIGVNALEIRHEQRDVVATVILIEFGDGYIEGQDDTAVTAYGRRVAMLRVSDVMDGPTAIWSAYATLQPIKAPALSITVKYDPVDDDDTPYRLFWCADKITCESLDGTPTLYPVESISGDEDDDGNIDWQLELSTATEVLAQVWQQWLSRSNNGTVSGRSRSASPSSPSIVQTKTLSWDEATFSYGGGQVAVLDDIGSPWAAERQERVVKIELRATGAGIADTTVELQKNGSATGDDITIAASTVVETVYPSAGEVYEIADYMWPKTTDAGGHEGLSLKVWLAPTGG